MSNTDERVAGHGRQAKEGDWSPAGEICEHQQSHSFGNCSVRMRGQWLIVSTDGSVHVAVAQTNKHEGYSVQNQQQ